MQTISSVTQSGVPKLTDSFVFHFSLAPHIGRLEGVDLTFTVDDQLGLTFLENRLLIRVLSHTFQDAQNHKMIIAC